MAFEVGQRVIAEKTGRRRRTARAPMRPPRHGVIEKVLRGDPNPRYEIRWDDRTTSIFSPMNGGIQADPDHPLIEAGEAPADEPAASAS